MPGHRAPGPEEAEAGHVIVFDDVTRLIEAQRSQAWEEVARRLAHEIKNPLTPIQLSAERLRHKYLDAMDGSDAESLDRLTRTIVQQVESMKEMVNAFSKYARTPARDALPADVNELVSDVAELYRDEDGGEVLHLDLGGPLPCVVVDPGQFRRCSTTHPQRARSARQPGTHGEEGHPGSITVGTRRVVDRGREYVETRIDDAGAGIDGAVLGRLFEPYVSTKPRGTGLGLAIVKKIVEEHDGTVTAENRPEGGASLIVRLPAAPAARPAPAGEAASAGAGHG